MDSSPDADRCSDRGLQEAEDTEFDDTTRYTNVGLAATASPPRFQRPSAPRRRLGGNATSPSTSHAESDSDSDIIERERMSPIPVSRIQNVLGQGHEAIGLFTSTSYDPTLLDVETRDEAQVVTPKDQESQEIDMGSASGDTSPDANDSSPPFLDSERDRAEQEAQEAPATQSLWLPTRNIDSPISHGQGKSEGLLDPQGSDYGEDIRRSSTDESIWAKIRDQGETGFEQQPDQEEQETQQASENQAAKEMVTKDQLEKVLREYELVKSERDRLLEDVDTLRGENAQWVQELSEARKKFHAVENENIQTRLARDKDWKYLEDASESAMAEITSVERMTVRLEKENSELRDKQVKLESQLKDAELIISEQRSRIEGLQTELDPLRASEDRSKEARQAQERESERHRAELSKIMEWLGKQRAQQHLLYPVVVQFCDQHMTRLLDQIQSYGIQQSIPPSPYQYQSLGELVKTPSELAPSSRQSMASQSSTVAVRYHPSRVLSLPPLAASNPRPQSLPGQDLIYQQRIDTDRNGIVFKRPALILRPLRKEDISRGKDNSDRIPRPGTAPSQLGDNKPISQYSSRGRGLSPFSKHSWANSQDDAGPNVNKWGEAIDTLNLQGMGQSLQLDEAEESVVRGNSTQGREAPSPEATSSAIGQPQSPGLRKRFGSYPPKSPPRSVGNPVLLDREELQTVASPPSRTDSETLEKKFKADASPVEAAIEDYTNDAYRPTDYTTFHSNIFGDGRPKISRSQSLTRPGNSINESGLRHRRPYSWDLKANQTSSQLTEKCSNGLQGPPSVACNGDGTDEVSVPRLVFDFGQRLLHTSSYVPSALTNTSSVTGLPESTHGGSQRSFANGQHSPHPFLNSSSAASGQEETRPADPLARKIVRLVPRSRRRTRVKTVQKEEIFPSIFDMVNSSIDSFSDICESVQGWMSDIVSVSDPGTVSTRLSIVFSEWDVAGLILDNDSQSSGASVHLSESPSASEKRGPWLDEGTPSDVEGEHPTSHRSESGAAFEPPVLQNNDYIKKASTRSESGSETSRQPRQAYVESCSESESDSASVDGTTRSPVLDDVGQSDSTDEHSTSYQADFETDSERDRDDGTIYTNAKPHDMGPDTRGSKMSSSTARARLPLPSPNGSQPARSSTNYSAKKILDRRPSYFILAILLLYIAVDMAIIVSVHAAPLIGGIWQMAQAWLGVLLAAVWNLTVSVALRQRTPSILVSSPVSESGIIMPPIGSMSSFDTTPSMTASMPKAFNPYPRRPISTRMSPSPTTKSSPGLNGNEQNNDIPTTVWILTTSPSPPLYQVKHNQTSAADLRLDADADAADGPRNMQTKIPQPNDTKQSSAGLQLDVDVNHEDELRERTRLWPSNTNASTSSKAKAKAKSRASPKIHVLRKTREWTGPAHLDFTPGIRRFIDKVRFDVTVMIDAVGR